MTAVRELAPRFGVQPLCRALGVPRASFYRRLTPRRPSPRALSAAERDAVLALLRAPAFVDQAPRAVFAALLDRRRYLCSTRTMFRIVARRRETRERRDQLTHPAYAKPELLAAGPNQVWSWDITKLRGPRKWSYYHLYVVLDIFSRYVTGWMVAERESAALAVRLLHDTCAKQGVRPGTLTGLPPFAGPTKPRVKASRVLRASAGRREAEPTGGPLKLAPRTRRGSGSRASCAAG